MLDIMVAVGGVVVLLLHHVVQHLMVERLGNVGRMDQWSLRLVESLGVYRLRHGGM